MTTAAAKAIRCAVYTRVSTDAGLEQDFNSLEAQREACEAYISSQTHEGWRLDRTRFDDGGFSGGTLDRPALQALLTAVRERRLDVVVVYKIDRLTRSLADFAKLVEIFDAHGASFVSVTQAFNTTTSMGRLTLNVLLSFAQFEREVTGERIRDKIAASKRKGLWMGGVVPLGYRVENRKLRVDPEEAATVRLIFERYRVLASLPALQRELRARAILTRRRELASGRIRGGVPFTNGPLVAILRNRTYIGEINHRDTSYAGEHEPIIAPGLFGSVQDILENNRRGRRDQWRSSEALLLGKLYDDRGNRMSPSYAIKKGVRYRYYVSCVLAQGRKAEAGSVPRIAAQAIEDRVLTALQPRESIASDSFDWRAALHAAVDRVVVRPTEIVITLHAEAAGPIRMSWTPPVHKRRRSLELPAGMRERHVPPSRTVMRAEARARVLLSIATAREWLDQILRGEVTGPADIARREKRSERSVRMLLSLAFLAPDIVTAGIEGPFPRGLGLCDMTELPMDWAEQRKRLGLG